jgi:hypothetical protein
MQFALWLMTMMVTGGAFGSPLNNKREYWTINSQARDEYLLTNFEESLGTPVEARESYGVGLRQVTNKSKLQTLEPSHPS